NGIQAGTLEILARAGVIDDFLRAGVRLRRTRIFGPGRRLLGEIPCASADCAYPFLCSLPQSWTERILEAHLRRLGGQVERGVTVASVEPGKETVQVRLARSDGAEDTVAVRYLLDAGGAHSVTRVALAEVLEGETYPGLHIVGDVRLAALEATDEATVCVNEGGYAFLAPLPRGRWTASATTGPGAHIAPPP